MQNAQVRKFPGEIPVELLVSPYVMTLRAIALLLVTVYFDGKIVADWASRMPFVFSSPPEREPCCQRWRV